MYESLCTESYKQNKFIEASLNDSIFSCIMRAVLSYSKRMKFNEKNAQSLCSIKKIPQK